MKTPARYQRVAESVQYQNLIKVIRLDGLDVVGTSAGMTHRTVRLRPRAARIDYCKVFVELNNPICCAGKQARALLIVNQMGEVRIIL